MRALKVGDVVLITGEMFTGRDAVHASPDEERAAGGSERRGAVSLRSGDAEGRRRWVTKAAGPTTSIREEPYQADVIRRYGVRAVIGKGGMGAKTSGRAEGVGAVYLNGIGGAAQYYARTVEEVLGVHLMEFGIPEAMWHLRVKDFAGNRHDGCARQQSARRRREGDRRKAELRCSRHERFVRIEVESRPGSSVGRAQP